MNRLEGKIDVFKRKRLQLGRRGRPKKQENINRTINEQTRYKLYGLTPRQYKRMLEEQSYVCAICGQTNKGRKLVIDHDHYTGRVRGLLCHLCNSGLGMFLDDVRLLSHAIVYLEDAEYKCEIDPDCKPQL